VQILNEKLVIRKMNIVHLHHLIFKDRRNLKFIPVSPRTDLYHML